MKDKKLRILVIIGAIWAALFLITLRIKAPILEGVEVAVLVGGLCWLFYWTISIIRSIAKKSPEPTTTEANASQTTDGECL